MKLKFIILIFIFSALNLFAQVIPDTSKAVISANINSICNSINKNPEDLIKDIIKEILKKEASSFNISSYFAFEKTINSIDFKKDMKCIMFNMNSFAFIIHYNNKNDLQNGLYELFQEESIELRRHLGSYDGIEFISADENIMMGFKDGILCISFSESGVYSAMDYAKKILAKVSSLRNEVFLELERKNHDIYVVR